MGDRKRIHYDSNTNYGPPQKKPYSAQPSGSGSNESLLVDQGVPSSNSINYQAIANIDISEPEWLEVRPILSTFFFFLRIVPNTYLAITFAIIIVAIVVCLFSLSSLL